MIPAAFDYLAPTSVEEALAALAEGGEDTKVLGGGQSLLPILRMRLNAPERLVDLRRIEELRGIREEGDHLVIGAMTRYSDIVTSPVVRLHAALLAQAVEEVADPQIRHRGTIGGALVHADPAGDVGAPVLALEADLVIRGPGGERTVPSNEFFVDLFETAVGRASCSRRFAFPSTPAGSRTTRSSCGSSASGRSSRSPWRSRWKRAPSPRPASASPTWARRRSRPRCRTALQGRPASDVGDACERAAEGTNPPTDLNGDADYRRHLARVLTRRAVTTALGD